MTGRLRTLVGEHGFERAAVWSVTGFAVILVAFRAGDVLGSPGVPWITAVSMTVVALGVVGFARLGGGALPSMLLAYGPAAAVLFETVGPSVSIESGGGVAIDPGTGAVAAIAVMEPFVVAVAAAIVVGGAGFVIGRGLAALGGPDGPDRADDDPGVETSTET